MQSRPVYPEYKEVSHVKSDQYNTPHIGKTKGKKYTKFSADAEKTFDKTTPFHERTLQPRIEGDFNMIKPT